jgi:hypothetical protein
MKRVLITAVLACAVVAAVILRQPVRDSSASIFLLGLLAGVALTAAATLGFGELRRHRSGGSARPGASTSS